MENLADENEKALLDKVGKAAQRVKLFPLPMVALFPHQGVPLHVFEPRYRKLAQDALSSDGVVALPQTRPHQGPGHVPEVSRVFGVGIIAEHEQLHEGRYNIVVRGIARARLVQEIASDNLYREAEIEILDEDASGVTADDTSALSACLLELSRAATQDTQSVLRKLSLLGNNPGRLADLTAAVMLNPGLHQSVMAELNVKKRLTWVTEQIALMLLSSKSPSDMTMN